MSRVLSVFFLLVFSAFAATVRLYLTDGSYQMVREYQVSGDRVRFYSVERSAWEEIPLRLVDIKRTQSEETARKEAVQKEAAEISAEEQFERQQREELERIPQEKGVYLVSGQEIKGLKQAESKVASNKGRSVLKVLSPVPVVAGKSTVEIDGEHSANVLATDRPEFYIRLAIDERFGIVRMSPKKGARIVQKWTIIPVTNEVVEEQQDIEVFRRQVDDGLYKIWPAKPLEPGEYAVIEYSEGKGNVQTWDFACRPGTTK